MTEWTDGDRGGRRSAALGGALLLSCRPQALQRTGLWLKFMGDRSDVGAEMAGKCALKSLYAGFFQFPPSSAGHLFGLDQKWLSQGICVLLLGLLVT